MAKPMVVVVTSQVSGLTSGMAEAARAVQESAGRMQQSFQGGTAAGKELDVSFQGLTRTMRSEHRMVSLWTTSLGQMTGAGAEGTRVMGELGGAIAAVMSGNVILIAVEAIRGFISVLGLLQKKNEEVAKERAKQSTKAQEDLEKERQALIKVEQQLDKNTDAIVRNAKAEADVARYAAQVAVENARMAEANARRALENQPRTADPGTRIATQITLQRALDQAVIDTTVAEERLRVISIRGSEQIIIAKGKAAEAAAAAGAKAEKDLDRQMQDDLRRTKVTEDAKVEAIRQSWLVEQEGRMIAARLAQQDAANALRLLQGTLREEDKYWKEYYAGVAWLRKSENETAKKDIKERQDRYMEIGNSIASVFEQIGRGAKSFGDAIKMMLAGVLSMIIDTIKKQILADAAASAAEAYKSQAGIPIVGPFLAAAAAVAALSLVQGFVGRVGSAAGGWELPSSGGPFLAVLHTDEKVLPADTSKGLDRLIASGDGGGFHLHVHGAMDAQSFVDTFERHQSTWLRMQRQWARDGRT